MNHTKKQSTTTQLRMMVAASLLPSGVSKNSRRLDKNLEDSIIGTEM